MYIVRAVKVGPGSLRNVMGKLRAWYAFRKLYEVGSKRRPIRYYLVADDESLEALTKALEASGHSVEVRGVGEVPWYMEELVEGLSRRAEELRLKRRCLELLKPVFRGEATVREVAERSGLSYDKLLRLKRRLSRSVFIEFVPRVGYEELLRGAIAVGLAPLTKTLYYSGSFNSSSSAYSEALEGLGPMPYSALKVELRRRLRAMYGLEARRAMRSLYSSEAYHRLVATSKALELRGRLDVDFNVFTIH